MGRKEIIGDIINAFKSKGIIINEKQAEIAYDSYMLNGRDIDYFDCPTFNGIVDRLKEYLPKDK